MRPRSARRPHPRLGRIARRVGMLAAGTALTVGAGVGARGYLSRQPVNYSLPAATTARIREAAKRPFMVRNEDLPTIEKNIQGLRPEFKPMGFNTPEKVRRAGEQLNELEMREQMKHAEQGKGGTDFGRFWYFHPGEKTYKLFDFQSLKGHSTLGDIQKMISPAQQTALNRVIEGKARMIDEFAQEEVYASLVNAVMVRTGWTDRSREPFASAARRFVLGLQPHEWVGMVIPKTGITLNVFMPEEVLELRRTIEDGISSHAFIEMQNHPNEAQLRHQRRANQGGLGAMLATTLAGVAGYFLFRRKRRK